ncbi:MAG: hypothetical protein V4586_17040 [Pseudomonadota bacterium]
MNVLGPDNAFWIDGEWLSWDDIPDLDEDDFHRSHLAKLEHEAELRFQYPNADIALIPVFRDLLELAERYHLETGRHLQIYGDLGELFGAITYGIKLHRNYAKGSDGRLGDDHVEVKTITPFKTKDVVEIDTSGNFSKLLVVKINAAFQVSGRMIDRKQLPKSAGRYLPVRWSDLPSPT